MDLSWVHFAAFVVVLVCWVGFAGVFFLRKRPAKAATRTRNLASMVGVMVQGLGFACVWTLRRPIGVPIVPLPGLLQVIPAFFAMGLAGFSLWLAWIAIRTLGKEWSIEARLVEGHRLVIAGPYGAIRHPIYASMLGMMIATGLVVSRPEGLLIGLIFGTIGTALRVHIEDRLLREQFHGEFDEYARRVPALVPRLWS